MTPYNALALAIKIEGYDAITLYKLLGNVFDSENSLERIRSIIVSMCRKSIERLVFICGLRWAYIMKPYLNLIAY